jgi:hypothetical protein
LGAYRIELVEHDVLETLQVVTGIDVCYLGASAPVISATAR